MSIEYAGVGDGITIAYEEFGDPDATPLLLITGLSYQMLAWRDDFVQALVDEGLRVVRFDNRDIGLSTHLSDAGMPDLGAIFAGDVSTAPYLLDDMARDTAGLLDALGIDSAHVVGVSMGGMIAQMLAANHPERVRSLTSIMSTTGEEAVSQPTEAAMAMLFRPPPADVDGFEQRALENAGVVGSPAYPPDEQDIREFARASFERAFDPAGVARQIAAIRASADRTEAVRSIRAPTLVIHGEEDPLVPVAGGRATAAAVEGSELIAIDGMGHDLPRALWPRFIDAIAGHVRRAQGATV